MNVTGLVLAGGRGTRMGSVDKGLQPLHGKPLVEHVIQRLSPQVDVLHINANQNLNVYAAYGLPVWPDVEPDFAGPLAGLQTGLIHCATPLLVTVPCDSPYLPTDLVARLWAGLDANDADIAVAVTGEDPHRQMQSVFLLVKVSLLPHLKAFLAARGRKVDAWFSSLKVAEVHFADEDAFRNINTLRELQESAPLAPIRQPADGTA